MKMVVVIRRRLLSYRRFLGLHSRSYFQNKNSQGLWKNESCTVQATLSDAKTVTFSSGEYARLADGSVVTSLGDTSVMAIAVGANTMVDNDGLPLTVNYRQKAAAAGRIPTNFLRREIGQSQQEILSGRVIDRSIRPFFPDVYPYETQVTCNLMAADGINDPQVVSINAASAALSISDIPWNGPVAAVRVGLINKEPIINPTRKELEQSSLNLIVTGASKYMVVMLEGAANEVSTVDVNKAIKYAVKECQIIIDTIKALQRKCGKQKRIIQERKLDENIEKVVKTFAHSKLTNIFNNQTLDKMARDVAVREVRDNLIEILKDGNLDAYVQDAHQIFNKYLKTIFRDLVLEKNIRCDGRKLDALRNISCNVDVFKPLHGSSVFRRGQTQVLCTVTLDSKESALKMDPVSLLTSDTKVKNFFLHYEFPPYATNETGKIGGVNRRELGHGALAEKGLRPVVPKDYPFTVRLTCEVLESNGSSSMASVCAGSLALMDAGVPIKAPTAGVAMGLITAQNEDQSIENYKILTDILGIEDYLGDMDFKIAATKKGITALQLDLKIPGIPLKIVYESIDRSALAIRQILQTMNSVIPSARSTPKENMPVVETIEVPVHLRGKFTGVGGLNIQRILLETGVQIHPESETTYSLFAPNRDAMAEAKEMIDDLLKNEVEASLEFGSIYTAKIVEIRDTGVMVTLYSNMKPALLPTSQLDQRRVQHPDALGLAVGQEIQVKYFGRDPATGAMRLSRKVLQEPVSYTRTLQR